MISVDHFLRLNGGYLHKPLATLNSQQIRYNIEASENRHFEDNKHRAYFFIISQYPKKILDKIVGQFDRDDIRTSLEEGLFEKGPVEGTVNKYLLAIYDIKLIAKDLDFSFTNLPVVKDSNLSSDYERHMEPINYIRKFIDK